VVLPPESPEELYAFFVPNLIKPPMMPDSICSGIQLDRSGWHIEIYRRSFDLSLHMWFYSHPRREPKWVISHGMFAKLP
jgi:hypothetical protein